MFPVLRFLAVLLLSSSLAGADTIREALVSLCDLAKIATISSDRGANPRVRKICYWLEMARRDGRDKDKKHAIYPYSVTGSVILSCLFHFILDELYAGLVGY
jgi:hypothetical protein